MKNMRRCSAVWPIAALLVFLALVGSCSTRKETPKEAAVSSEASPKEESAPSYVVQDLPGGVLAGRVLFNGKAPAPKVVQVNQDPDVCGTRREVYPVEIEKGGIVDAVVWIDDIHRGKPFAFPEPVLDQKHCSFVPHIVLMKPGELTTETSDPMSHNLHTYAGFNRNYNESVNQLRRSLTMRFQRPERVGIRCDLHKWMQAYVVIAANPYYTVTQKGGRFELDGVPPGHYHLKAWQETLGEMEQEVVVEPAKTTKADFNFKLNSTPSGGGQ